jgi:hypothetical protein
VHLHGCLPYFFARAEGHHFFNSVAELAAAAPRIEELIESALATIRNESANASEAQGGNPPGATTSRYVSKKKMVAGVEVTKGMPFYGYHADEQLFLKIYVYDPRAVAKVASLLQSGVVLDCRFQPYESHIPYLLQAFVDASMSGMDFLHLSFAKFRLPLPALDNLSHNSDGSRHNGKGFRWHAQNVRGEWVSPADPASTVRQEWEQPIWAGRSCRACVDANPAHPFSRTTTSELEVDCLLDHIVNRSIIQSQLSGTQSQANTTSANSTPANASSSPFPASRNPNSVKKTAESPSFMDLDVKTRRVGQASKTDFRWVTSVAVLWEEERRRRLQLGEKMPEEDLPRTQNERTSIETQIETDIQKNGEMRQRLGLLLQELEKDNANKGKQPTTEAAASVNAKPLRIAALNSIPLSQVCASATLSAPVPSQFVAHALASEKTSARTLLSSPRTSNQRKIFTHTHQYQQSLPEEGQQTQEEDPDCSQKSETEDMLQGLAQEPPLSQVCKYDDGGDGADDSIMWSQGELDAILASQNAEEAAVMENQGGSDAEDDDLGDASVILCSQRELEVEGRTSPETGGSDIVTKDGGDSAKVGKRKVQRNVDLKFSESKCETVSPMDGSKDSKITLSSQETLTQESEKDVMSPRHDDDDLKDFKATASQESPVQSCGQVMSTGPVACGQSDSTIPHMSILGGENEAEDGSESTQIVCNRTPNDLTTDLSLSLDKNGDQLDASRDELHSPSPTQKEPTSAAVMATRNTKPEMQSTTASKIRVENNAVLSRPAKEKSASKNRKRKSVGDVVGQEIGKQEESDVFDRKIRSNSPSASTSSDDYQITRSISMVKVDSKSKSKRGECAQNHPLGRKGEKKKKELNHIFPCYRYIKSNAITTLCSWSPLCFPRDIITDFLSHTCLL